MDELQASCLRLKLPLLDSWNQRRREIVGRYHLRSQGSGFDIVHRASSDYVAHLCVARHAHRETVRQALKQAGIDTAIHYPVPDHRQPALEQVSWRSGGLQITERVQSEIMTLPCYAEMTEEEVDYVGSALRDCGK